MRATLLVPGPLATISGGYNYDRRMLAEWTRAGHEVTVQQGADWSAISGIPIIDGLGLPAFADAADRFAERGAIGLIHHPVSLENGVDETLKSLETALFAKLPRLIATSETTAAALVAQFAVPPERITIVVPGTDPAPRSPVSPGPTCNILALGALIPRKGHDTLLRALAKLFDLDWHLTIAGGDPESPHGQSLAALAAELGIEQRVSFPGTVTADALETLWHGADLFALATHYEGYGMAIAEALKRGLPCAITGGGAAGQLVPPEAGAVCEPGDVVQLSKALRRMIFDTDLRRDMAEAAWQAGAKLPDWPAQARSFAEAIGL